jgi:hypothetical protein
MMQFSHGPLKSPKLQIGTNPDAVETCVPVTCVPVTWVAVTCVPVT